MPENPLQIVIESLRLPFTRASTTFTTPYKFSLTFYNASQFSLHLHDNEPARQLIARTNDYLSETSSPHVSTVFT